jgi:glycosyltransferase involved in cell wall biosynthesis
MRALFMTHSAALSGAELRLLQLMAGLRPDATALVLEQGPLTAELRARGIRTESLAIDGAIAGVRRESGWRDGARSIPHVAQILRQIIHARRRFEVTVAFSQKAFVLSALAQPWVRRPLIWTLNDILSDEHFSPAMRSLVIELANSCARSVVANSQASADAFTAFGGRKERIRVIYPGIDLESFSDAKPAQEHTARPSGLRIGCFGRLSPWKGQHILIQALVDISQVEAWIVGDALFGEESYKQELRALTARLGLDHRVRFFGHRTDVPELVAACDIVAHTSIAPEPFGKVIVEGMASGRPVIATAAGGVVEIIRDGIDGLLVPPGNVEALSATLRRLVANPRLRTKLAEGGRAHSRAFSAVTMADAYRSVLSDVTSNPDYASRLRV